MYLMITYLQAELSKALIKGTRGSNPSDLKDKKKLRLKKWLPT